MSKQYSQKQVESCDFLLKKKWLNVIATNFAYCPFIIDCHAETTKELIIAGVTTMPVLVR